MCVNTTMADTIITSRVFLMCPLPGSVFIIYVLFVHVCVCVCTCVCL